MKLLILLAAAALASAQQSTEKLFDEIEPMIAELSAMTGLAPLKRVERDFITRDKLKEFLVKRIKEVTKPEEIHAEELTLKMFGLVPEDFNLEQATVAVMTEQAAAFYDYRKKRMFVLEGQQDEMQRIALFHELAHALADQHFNLAKYILKSNTDDAATARGAVMEGQAQWLMMERMAKKMGQSLLTSDTLLSMVGSMADQASLYPELAKSPMYIRESLLFPYTSGMLFQNAVLKKMGNDGFSEVFKRAPISTQQILHSEKYFEKLVPAVTKLEKVPNTKEYKKLLEGGLGEFDITMLLKQYDGKESAERIAPHWRGGRIALFETKKDKKPLLQHAVEFDTPEAASQYLEIYRQIMKKKSREHNEVAAAGVNNFAGSTQAGKFELKLSGTTVSSLEGIR